ncbi:MAG: hypothetical protein IT370_13305 [Deltaproteobacteria bacterium]|nr:hypothetical protein [Deltaproteobacteria bacterium]
MATQRLIFLSDTHVGTGARTNWYQPALHEPLLVAALDWVCAQSATIAELVVLGDFFDQWTYAPAVRPPSIADIVAANPRVMGPAGALARALTALDGRVSYLSGNHDMLASAADIAAICDGAGRSMRVVTDFPYLPAAGQGQVACAHGQQFSILNAGDWGAMPATGLPVGYFITRVAALWSQQQLGPGQTVADLAGAGEPTGWPVAKDALATLVSSVIEKKLGLAELALGTLLDATAQTDALPVVMPDGSTMTVGQARGALYDDLYDRYKDSGRFPGAAYGDEPAFFALTGTDLGNSLQHFARELGKRHRVVVMGHTHVDLDHPLDPLLGKDSIYANSGFGCPAAPDMQRAQQPLRPTFVEVQVDDVARQLTVLVWMVLPGPVPVVVPAPLAPRKIGF